MTCELPVRTSRRLARWLRDGVADEKRTEILLLQWSSGMQPTRRIKGRQGSPPPRRRLPDNRKGKPKSRTLSSWLRTPGKAIDEK
jgi:hypothetical protein